MEWINGGIYIVELPAYEHEKFLVENRPDGQPAYEPDESYGPAPEAGSHLPVGVENFTDWRTLVVEIGYSRTWGDAHGHLDWKAQRWAEVPGVCYVLCVAITAGLATAEYKLYRVNRPRGQLPAHIAFIKNPNEPPVSIVPPRTEVHFDARTLLGLEPGDLLPRDPPNNGVEFPDPLVVDLYQVLVRARR